MCGSPLHQASCELAQGRVLQGLAVGALVIDEEGNFIAVERPHA